MSQRKNTENKKMLHNALILNKPQRHVRSLTDPRQNCGKWSQWIDDHHPTLQDKGDREFMPADKLNEFCPSTYGGHISKMMCRDNKGEPAFGNRTDGKIFIFCSDLNHGVTCSMVQNINDTCPDMAVQYFCNCTPTTTAVSKAVQPLTVTPGVMSAQSILISGLSQSTTDPRLHTTSSIGLPVYSDVSKAVQSLIVTPGVMQPMSSQSSSILTSGSTEISTDPRFRTTALIGLSVSSDSVVANNKTGNNTSVEERKITGAENCDENLQTSTFSVKWWIFVIIISGSLLAVNIVVSVYLYKSAITKRARQNEVQPN